MQNFIKEQMSLKSIRSMPRALPFDRNLYLLFVRRSFFFIHSFIHSTKSSAFVCSFSRKDVRDRSTFLSISPLALFTISAEHGALHARAVGTSAIFRPVIRDHLHGDLFCTGLSAPSRAFDGSSLLVNGSPCFSFVCFA